MKLIAFDTETYLIGSRDKAPKPVCCTWYEGVGSPFISHPGDPVTWNLLTDPERIFCGVNLPYDFLVMMRWHPQFIPHIIRALDEGRVIDLPIRAGLLHLATTGSAGYNPTGMSLADLAQKYLGRDLSASKQGDDIWRLKFGTLDGVPFNQWPTEAITYALDDARHTYDVCMQLGDPYKIYPTEEAQNQAALVLGAIGTWGFTINQPIRGKLKEVISAQIADLDNKTKHLGWTGKGSQARLGAIVTAAWREKQLKIMAQYAAMTGVYVDVPTLRERLNVPDMRTVIIAWGETGRIPPDVPIQFQPGRDPIAWLAEVVQILPEVPMTKKGISTAEEYLDLIADEMPRGKDANGTEFSYGRAYVDLKHKIKMQSTYIEPYHENTIHPRFVPMVATGRTGCREPNLQNIPRKDKDRPEEAFRTMFMARPGRILGTVDYSQLELCTLAATIRTFYPNIRCTLGEAIDANVDAHCHTGGLVAGLSYDQMLAGKKAKDANVLDFRQGAKAANFGLPGGLGAGTFVDYAKNNYNVRLTLDQAKKIIAAWRTAWPEMVWYLKDAGNIIANAGGGRATAYTINGFTKANCFYTELANFRFQSLAAEGAKRALWAIYRECMLGWFWKYFSQGFGYGSDFRDGALADSKLVNFVHDEIVAEHIEGDSGKKAMARQEKLMVDTMTKTCQNKITIRVEGALSHQWEH